MKNFLYIALDFALTGGCVEKMATVVHHGSYNTINQAYAALPAWIEANGYKIIGSNREVYVIGGNEQENESYVTEVQFPVAKA